MATDRLTIALNLVKTAPTQYGNFNFKSYCKFGDKILGSNEDGIFILESGDKDDSTDITAFFVLGPTDFGAENEKRIRKCYVSGRLDGRLLVTYITDDEEVVIQELVPVNNQLKLTHHEVQGGRDIRGKYLQLKIANVAGSDFTISNIQAVLVVLGQNAEEGA